jgi:hypothetical protein
MAKRPTQELLPMGILEFTKQFAKRVFYSSRMYRSQKNSMLERWVILFSLAQARQALRKGEKRETQATGAATIVMDWFEEYPCRGYCKWGSQKIGSNPALAKRIEGSDQRKEEKLGKATVSGL